MKKRLLLSLGILILIAGLAYGVISYSKGYRFNYKEKSLTSTGILSASSYPQNSSILIDNKLTAATNASITLAPGWYQVKITKEGYQSWEKKIRIQGEVVSTIDVLLLPTNPSFRTLTTSGVSVPVLSPSGTRVAYIFMSSESSSSATTKLKDGIYTLDLRSGPLGSRSDPKPIFTPSYSVDFKNAALKWSFDEKQIMMTITKTDAKKKTTVTDAQVIDVDNINTPPINVTTTYQDQLDLWNTLKLEKDDLALTSLPASLSAFLKTKTDMIRFSPDETKIFYQATSSAVLAPVITPPIIGSNPTEEVRSVTPGAYYVFDLKEDKNFLIVDNKKNPQSTVITGWYTDSKHLILVSDNTISFVDYDGTNKRSVYSGPFVDSIVYPWATGGEIVVLTNFNNPQSAPNFYEIDLR
jgi:hypothetical protein